MEKQEFNVGTKVYYPVHGVAELTSLETREISGTEFSIYVLTVVESGLKIMVPTSNALNVGMRELLTLDEVGEVYEILQCKEGGSSTQTWNRRHREYMDKIKTGSAFEIAEVMRDPCVLRDTKTLSFGERRMLETARGLLVREIACIRSCSEELIIDEIESFYRAAAA